MQQAMQNFRVKNGVKQQSGVIHTAINAWVSKEATIESVLASSGEENAGCQSQIDGEAPVAPAC